MPSSGILSIGEVNALADEQFEWLFCNVIEHTPEAAREVALKKPFDNLEHLKKAFYDYLDGLESYDRECVLVKHPDLAGKLCDEGKLTSESKNEQISAGLDKLTTHEREVLMTHNSLYKERFKIPFIICARENKVPAILEGIQVRLQNSRDTEVAKSIEEVKKICSIRISDLVWSNPV